MVFEWDPNKDQANLEKHRITFTEATSVFGDPLARIFAHEDHSAEERRDYEDNIAPWRVCPCRRMRHRALQPLHLTWN
ncbi:MAG: BrnT family toxin [Bryobacteraceae bacterium]|nr:BrnT family toxin [Bryobacteraceae bacterium]